MELRNARVKCEKYNEDVPFYEKKFKSIISEMKLLGTEN